MRIEKDIESKKNFFTKSLQIFFLLVLGKKLYFMKYYSPLGNMDHIDWMNEWYFNEFQEHFTAPSICSLYLVSWMKSCSCYSGGKTFRHKLAFKTEPLCLILVIKGNGKALGNYENKLYVVLSATSMECCLFDIFYNTIILLFLNYCFYCMN